MNRVHLTLQGKGGVGKSIVTSLLAQHQLSKHRNVLCIDTDPVNRTLGTYARLGAIELPILEHGEVKKRGFDVLMEHILAHDGEVVVDAGASTFLPLSRYVLTQGVFELLGEAERQVMIHTVIAGDQALQTTLGAVHMLAQTFPAEAYLVAWLNAYFGPIEIDGVGFEQMAIYHDIEPRLHGIVYLDKQDRELVEPVISEMLTAALTFEEAIASDRFRLMDKQRLKMVQRRVYEQLDLVVG